MESTQSWEQMRPALHTSKYLHFASFYPVYPFYHFFWRQLHLSMSALAWTTQALWWTTSQTKFPKWRKKQFSIQSGLWLCQVHSSLWWKYLAGFCDQGRLGLAMPQSEIFDSADSRSSFFAYAIWIMSCNFCGYTVYFKDISKLDNIIQQAKEVQDWLATQNKTTDNC